MQPTAQLAARAEETASLLATRAREIAGTFDEADQRLVARAPKPRRRWPRAPANLAQFRRCRSAAEPRIGKSAEALAARAAELVTHIRRRRRTACHPHFGERRNARRACQRDRRSFEQADERLAARVNETANVIGGRATGEIWRRSSRRPSGSAGSRHASTKARTRSPHARREIGRIFENADQRLAARVDETRRSDRRTRDGTRRDLRDRRSTARGTRE